MLLCRQNPKGTNWNGSKEVKIGGIRYLCLIEQEGGPGFNSLFFRTIKTHRITLQFFSLHQWCVLGLCMYVCVSIYIHIFFVQLIQYFLMKKFSFSETYLLYTKILILTRCSPAILTHSVFWFFSWLFLFPMLFQRIGNSSLKLL